MAEPTPGERENAAAFEVMLEKWQASYRTAHMYPRYLDNERRQWMIFAWQAGLRHGEEKRGCCHEGCRGE